MWYVPTLAYLWYLVSKNTSSADSPPTTHPDVRPGPCRTFNSYQLVPPPLPSISHPTPQLPMFSRHRSRRHHPSPVPSVKLSTLDADPHKPCKRPVSQLFCFVCIICLLSLVGHGVFHTWLNKQEFTPPAAGSMQEFDLEKLTDVNARLVQREDSVGHSANGEWEQWYPSTLITQSDILADKFHHMTAE